MFIVHKTEKNKFDITLDFLKLPKCVLTSYMLNAAFYFNSTALGKRKTTFRIYFQLRMKALIPKNNKFQL